MTAVDVADRLALRALVDQYALAADALDYAAYGQLFVAEAVFTGRCLGESGPFVRVQGNDKIGGLLHANDSFVQTFHAVHNHICAIDGDAATGTTYCVARHYRETADGAEIVILPLRYHDTYARTHSGWRFSSREICFTWAEKAVADPTEFKNWTRGS
ncbi:nuclear transport factor 2 family protein [Mycobacteroides abscessus]|uniref:nuclear transport factor 2 family protein n=1 Tax=Mycobacteroides abscessus TaxID=36809 RepID=UPI0005E6E91E|nr:nuclear transport factor 2 family protein [Mycobacteroides abscessus]CPS43692.1 small subunit of phenylpropionate dioxygenase [Mycobacteroides abscessus]CPS45520.1 small subunit of phenylpropionate dioxygenase [Mycobacteroides abscessus]CPS54573.1 small subunit of phenylpropionate dioxygenase [Mycobacteroides abscessus]CPT37310.1 small subunit of phenylpropionate dioxygenase [Mycobacteroides abscessus]CPT64382.1 small subunit of phenylpropionate dioxygenase [Mycobacteroides abscessus]